MIAAWSSSCIPIATMRDYDEEDPKKPRPVGVTKKRTNPLEGSEGVPWRHLKHDDRDRHRHL